MFPNDAITIILDNNTATDNVAINVLPSGTYTILNISFHSQSAQSSNISCGAVVLVRDYATYDTDKNMSYLCENSVTASLDNHTGALITYVPYNLRLVPNYQTFPSSIGVNNFPASQTINGTIGVNNFPASQTINGTIGVNNFPATSSNVHVTNFPDGFNVNNFPAIQTITGDVNATGLDLTGAVIAGTFTPDPTIINYGDMFIGFLLLLGLVIAIITLAVKSIFGVKTHRKFLGVNSKEGKEIYKI